MSDTQHSTSGAPEPIAALLPRYAIKLVEVFLGVLLGLMVIAIAWQIASRYIFSRPSVYSEEFLRFGLIWLGFIAAGYGFGRGRHLSLPILTDMLPPRGRGFIGLVNFVLNFAFGLVLIWGGWISMASNWTMTTPMMQISVGMLQSVLVISGLMICITQATLARTFILKGSATIGQLVGAVALVIAIGSGLMFLWQTEAMQTLVWDHLELTSTIVLFITFSIFLVIGSPITIGLAFAGVLTLGLQVDLVDVFSTVGSTMFNGLDSFGFLALPFFILAGNIMNATGLARRLIDFAMLIGGRIPGSLWQTNVLANMLFGTLSGSGIAAATAIGGIINPVAREKGYDMAITTAVNAASAPSGMLIPPSGALIVYSLITGGSASIIALFMAGYLPGLIMGASVMIVSYWYAVRLGYEKEHEGHTPREVLRIFFRAAPSLLLVVIVIAGILGGAFTAIEGSGIAVVYALILGVIYRGLSLPKLFRILVESAAMTGIILFLIACSMMMSWAMTFASIPETIGSLMSAVSDNKYAILLMINIILLIIGVFMDMAPAMLIFTPIFYPIVTELGIDPVHFGVILVYNLAMGLVTPPVGTILFVSCSISGERIGNVIRPLLPIFFLQMIGLLLVTYVPAVAMAIPNAFGL